MQSHGHDGWLLRKNAVTFRTVLSASFSLLLLSSAFWPRRHADFGAINEAFHLNAGVEFPKKTRRLYTMDYASLVSPRPGDFPGVMKCRSEVRDKHVREIQQKRESRNLVRPFHSMSRGSPTFTDKSRAMVLVYLGAAIAAGTSSRDQRLAESPIVISSVCFFRNPFASPGLFPLGLINHQFGYYSS
jgi:hypothetical protein